MRSFKSAGTTCSAMLVASLALLTATAASAGPLTNGAGDGRVSVEISGNGSFGTAYHNPIGPQASGDTLYSSNAYLRIGTSGARTSLSNMASTFLSNNGTEAVSSFAAGALRFTLTQSLTDLRDTSGAVIGSMLTQSYSFINMSASTLEMSLARYVDGQMNFEGTSSGAAGGGTTLIDGTTRAVFETLRTVGLDEKTIFLGVTAEGGAPLGYEVDTYGALLGRVTSGRGLRNSVLRDANGDGLIDKNLGYDTGIALENLFQIGAGQQGQWVTRTLFGTGSLGSVSLTPPVPEPGTWAMMIVGFGLVGAGLRRKSRSLATT